MCFTVGVEAYTVECTVSEICAVLVWTLKTPKKKCCMDLVLYVLLNDGLEHLNEAQRSSHLNYDFAL